MGEIYRPESGKWWRFSQYELRDGLVRPADGAQLGQYDPWEEYKLVLQRVRHKSGKRLVQPYQSLVRVATTATLDSRGLPTPSTERDICDWCQEHGLLGIVPHYYPILPAHWTEYVLHGADQVRQPMVCAWQRGRWTSQPGAHPQLDGEFARFFPGSLNPAASVPAPDDRDFWCEYAEPVDRFLDEANRLKDALGALRAVEPANKARETLLQAVDVLRPLVEEQFLVEGASREPLDAKAVEPMKARFQTEAERRMLRQSIDLYQGMGLLNSLIGVVAPVILLPEDGGDSNYEYRQEWRFPSLLSSLAMMVVHDLSEGKHINECQKCHTPFLSTRPDAKYCPGPCQNTAQKRRQREREIEVGYLHKRGRSVKQIAAELDMDESVVARRIKKRGKSL